MKILPLVLFMALLSGGAVADEARLKTCQAKLKQAQKIDILVGIKVKPGRFLVTVGQTFYQMPFDAKEGFAENLNCLFNAGDSGPKSLCNEIRFIHWQTGKTDGEYSWCKLKMY